MNYETEEEREERARYQDRMDDIRREESDDDDDDNKIYKIAPRGLFDLAVWKVVGHDTLTIDQIDLIWMVFENSLKKHGFIDEK